MDNYNLTRVAEFILLGVTDLPEHEVLRFAFLLIFYFLNVVGNLSIMVVVIRYAPLHTPMYYLLANLSALDIGISSAVVPKMLANLLLEKKSISFEGCLTQLYFFHFLGFTETLILTSMSYDRYVAICHPLRYVVRMNQHVCCLLASFSWSTSFLQALFHTILTSRLPFCASNKVRHFFCDFKPLFKLACTKTYINELLIILINGFVAISAFFLILVSYIFIGSHILRIKSSHGRKKAFSTCASHLIIVVFFLGTAICTYARPPKVDSVEQDRIASILFTMVTPTLNPFIYTLRNKEVKRGIMTVLRVNTR